VLRAAMTVTQQRGYHGTTATRVAETAGVAPEVITSHFPSRLDMLRSSLELAYEDWSQEVPTFKPVEPLPDLRAEISRRLRQGVAASRRAADFWRLGLLMRLEPALVDSDCCDLFIDVRARTRDALRDYWRQILPDGQGDDAERVELAVNGHMSLVDGAIIAGHSNPDWDLERMMDFIATGVASALETPREEGSR
jgi:AcrR family transcriptional regulator